jgi:hypothetical protein
MLAAIATDNPDVSHPACRQGLRTQAQGMVRGWRLLV